VKQQSTKQQTATSTTTTAQGRSLPKTNATTMARRKITADDNNNKEKQIQQNEAESASLQGFGTAPDDDDNIMLSEMAASRAANKHVTGQSRDAKVNNSKKNRYVRTHLVFCTSFKI
jgi:hypothetical protein